MWSEVLDEQRSWSDVAGLDGINGGSLSVYRIALVKGLKRVALIR